MTRPSLNGRAIAFLEARMAHSMERLIRRHGGVPLSAPVLQEHYLQNSPPVRQAISSVCDGKIDLAIFLTGVGVQAILATARSMGLHEPFVAALNNLTVIARSPKPARVLRQHNIRIDLMPPEPFTSSDLTAAMAHLPLCGRRVILQRYGGPDAELPSYLCRRGAICEQLVLYDWGLPDDCSPAISLIDRITAGGVAALAFTSRPQVSNLLAIAAAAGRESALRDALCGPVTVASVGPVCTRQLRASGIPVAVEPAHPHMGSLIVALTNHFNPTDFTP